MEASETGLHDSGLRDRRLAGLIGALREASSAVDQMWRDAITGVGADVLVELGDASHGLHIALVALEDAETERRSSLT